MEKIGIFFTPLLFSVCGQLNSAFTVTVLLQLISLLLDRPYTSIPCIVVGVSLLVYQAIASGRTLGHYIHQANTSAACFWEAIFQEPFVWNSIVSLLLQGKTFSHQTCACVVYAAPHPFPIERTPSALHSFLGSISFGWKSDPFTSSCPNCFIDRISWNRRLVCDFLSDRILLRFEIKFNHRMGFCVISLVFSQCHTCTEFTSIQVNTRCTPFPQTGL